MSRPSSAPEHRPDARSELRHRVRLDEVVIGAAVKGGHDVTVAFAGSRHDHGHLGDRPNHSEQLDAVEVGKTEVEDHDIRLLRNDDLQPFHRRGRTFDMMSILGQRLGRQPPDMRIVLDQNDGDHSIQANCEPGERRA